MMKPLASIRLGGIILAAALLAALSACSAMKLGYGNLPHLAYWWLDGYVDFSDEQAPVVRDELARLHAWHRQQELPRVLDLLAQMERMAPQDVDAAQACTVFADVRARIDAFAAEAEPRVAAIAASLTGRELRYLQRKFERNNARFRKEWVNLRPDEVQEKRFDRMADRLETLYGKLEEPQRSVLRRRFAQSVFEPARTHAEWQRRQQDLLQVLRKVSHRGTPEGEARALLKGWLARVQRAPDPGYRAYQEALQQEGCATFAAVHASTTAAQREHAVQRLRTWQRELRELVLAP